MVLNNDAKMIKGTSILHVYGQGYDERSPVVAIIKMRLMLHLQSIKYLEHFLKK